MIEWVRSPIVQQCGSCRRSIAKGLVHLEIWIVAAGVVRRRCEPCAAGDYGVPPLVAPLTIAPQPSLPIEAAPAKTQAFVRSDHRAVPASLAEAQRDYRERQAND